VSAAIDILVVVVAVALIVYFAVIQPRQRRRRVDASLAILAPLVGGNVTKGRLHGTFRGYPLEAWQFKSGTGRSDSYARAVAVAGDRFTVRLGGVPGNHHWQCETEPLHVNPFSPPKLVLNTGLPSAGGIVRRLVGEEVTAPDPDLEERLRAHGLLDQMSRLQQEWKHVHVGFSGSLEAAAEHQMARRPGMPGLSQQVHERLRAATRLECQVEWRGELAPSPRQFQALLDTLEAILTINAAANPATTTSQVSALPDGAD
jgi:hypothetical protein